MIGLVFILLSLIPGAAVAAPPAGGPVLTVVLNSGTGEKQLKSWGIDALRGFRSISSREKDPETGEVVSWKGVSLAHLLDQALTDVSVEEKARIDLVILKNGSGMQAFIPRSLISHYPLILAWERGTPGLGERGPWYTVVPWTSKPKIMGENLPLERYFVPALAQVELTNYRNLYNAYFLKRRTDPSAVRGEKIFVQNCMGCHLSSQVPKITTTDPTNRVVASQGEHGTLKGVPKLVPRDWRALINYFQEYKNESAAPSSGSP